MRIHSSSAEQLHGGRGIEGQVTQLAMAEVGESEVRGSQKRREGSPEAPVRAQTAVESRPIAV
jgi:hypothetical protein